MSAKCRHMEVLAMDVNVTSGMSYAGQGSYVSQAEPVRPQPAEAPKPDKNAEETAGAQAAVNNQTTATDGPKEVSEDALKKAVNEINKNANGTEALFGIHDKTNRVTIKIVDKKTKEVIKELPPEKTLDLIAKAWEMAGILVDEKR